MMNIIQFIDNMVFQKKWKTNWELKSFTFEELENIILDVATKQLEDMARETATLSADLINDYDADSVDVVAMLLYLEEIFKNASTTRIVVPTNQLGQIVLLEDIFDLMYQVLLDVESKMETFTPLTPNLASLDKQKKIGELYK